jgi:hypothetical protein
MSGVMRNIMSSALGSASFGASLGTGELIMKDDFMKTVDAIRRVANIAAWLLPHRRHKRGSGRGLFIGRSNFSSLHAEKICGYVGGVPR